MRRGSALLLCAFASASQAHPDLGNWIERQRAEWSVPGVSVAVLRGGQPAQTFASGLCDVGKAKPCTPDSEFHLGSNTKFFTGVLATMLALEGKAAWSEPILSAWPEFRLSDPRWNEVTLRDVLSQRSGIGSIEWPYYWDLSLARKDYLARVPHVPIAEPFRGSWAYSNMNYVIAGTYLERKTGARWEELVRDRIFKPLGMKRSGFGVPGATRGYWVDTEGKLHAFAPAPVSANAPAGAIVSTAGDYAKFLAMILAGDKAARLASSPVVGVGFDRRFFAGPGGYALGAFTATYQGQTVLHHPGGYPGYTAHFVIAPDSKIAIAVLCNRNATIFAQALALGILDQLQCRDADAAMRAWREAEEPEPVAPPEDPSAPPTRPLAQYAGRYSHPGWGAFDVIASGEGLRIRMGSLDAPLDHLRYDAFSFASAPGWERLRLRFEAGFDGEIDGFVLDDAVNPAPQRFEKAPRKQ